LAAALGIVLSAWLLFGPALMQGSVERLDYPTFLERRRRQH
jgi:hypothetical protein